jgi:peptidoglycan-associated lipoprotein
MRLLTIAILGAAALLAACSDTDSAVDPSAAAGAGAGQAGPAPNTAEYFNVVVGDRVFFDTDRHDLTSDAQYVLSKQAQWFAANPGTTAVIEGHADERGTRGGTGLVGTGLVAEPPRCDRRRWCADELIHQPHHLADHSE